MRLTKKQRKNYSYSNFISLEEPHKSIANKLGQYEDIDEKLGISYPELIEILENGVWEVAGVDSENMKPHPDYFLYWRIYGIDFENKRLNGFRATGYNERSIERSNDHMFASLHLVKYKKKVLGGWSVKKEDLLE